MGRRGAFQVPGDLSPPLWARGVLFAISDFATLEFLLGQGVPSLESWYVPFLNIPGNLGCAYSHCPGLCLE